MSMYRPQYMEALDPSYIAINWGNVMPVPPNAWNLDSRFGGPAPQLPVPVINFPNVFTVANHDIAINIQGALTATFRDVHVFTWDLPAPLQFTVRY